MSTDELRSIARVLDPAFFEQGPHAVYSRMRAEAPVLRLEGSRAWALTRHEDIRYVMRTPEVFSSTRGILPLDIGLETPAEGAFAFDGEVVSLLDPPRHGELRRLIAPSFAPRAIASLEPQIRSTCEELVFGLPANEPVDVVEAVAKVLPVRTITAHLGFPPEMAGEFIELNDAVFNMLAQGSPEAGHLGSRDALDRMHRFIAQQIEQRRDQMGDDVVSSLIRAVGASDRVSVADVAQWARTLMVTGEETTRTLIGNMVYAFGRNPGQLTLLSREPNLAANSIDEVLRWCPIHHGFIRYVAEDTVLRGEHLEVGDFVFMLFEAANRDEVVFGDNADAFDIRRADAASHIGFGTGPHVCPGASLARLEATLLLETLIRRYPRWTIVGEPVRVRSNFVNELESLTVTFTRSGASRSV